VITAEPDYLALWRDLTLLGGQRFGPGFEQPERAASFDAASKRKNRSRRDDLLDQIRATLRPSDTVLDIGAGTGRWTIPLAAAAARVTAVEPAPAMLRILTLNAAEAGVGDKIDLVPATWEEAAVGIHDIAVCFHAAYMSADLAAFVRKMEAHVRRNCYLGLRHIAVDGIIQELAAQIHGTRHDSPNFIIAYNALYQMGIYANVTMEKLARTWVDATPQAAFERAKRHLHLTGDSPYDELIRATLGRRLELTGGLYRWPDRMTTALVSWDVGPT
jgi:2-polyprenyl-3-methyl-5-hydroxy-6-metoxy-1,4-benzoquinol methylase